MSTLGVALGLMAGLAVLLGAGLGFLFGMVLGASRRASNSSNACLGAGKPWALELLINSVKLSTRCGARSARCWAIMPPMLAPSR